MGELMKVGEIKKDMSGKTYPLGVITLSGVSLYCLFNVPHKGAYTDFFVTAIQFVYSL
jgi:hypothetical protein